MTNIYSKTQQAYEGMLQSCRNAQKEILFEQYIFEDYYPGGIGADFLEVFMKKAEEGLRVVLHIDALGSLRLYNDNKLLEKLQQSKVEIHFYKHLPLKMLFNLANLILRNHTKLLIVDKKETWIGGVVIGDQYRDWDDLMIRYLDKSMSAKMSKHFFRQLKRCEGRLPFRFQPYKINPYTEVLGNSPGFKNRFILKRIYRHIKKANKSITIISPYFSPPIAIWRQIIKAAKRGVKIKIIIPKDTDHKFINYVHRGYYQQLLRCDVEIYSIPRMVHSKLIIVDENWASFGSANCDSISLVFNHELNIGCSDKKLIMKLTRYSKRFLKKEFLVEKNNLKRSFLEKFKVQFYKIMRVIT